MRSHSLHTYPYTNRESSMYKLCKYVGKKRCDMSRRVIFLNTYIQSKSSIEETNNLPTNVPMSGFFVGVDTLVS